MYCFTYDILAKFFRKTVAQVTKTNYENKVRIKEVK